MRLKTISVFLLLHLFIDAPQRTAEDPSNTYRIVSINRPQREASEKSKGMPYLLMV